jgi:DNA-binding LacI/PurR family transcriptional regulator
VLTQDIEASCECPYDPSNDLVKRSTKSACTDDVSVVGMDGLPVAAFTNRGLTSVAMLLTEMAGTMIERAISRSMQPDLPAADFLFQPALIARQSVAKPSRAKKAASST